MSHTHLSPLHASKKLAQARYRLDVVVQRRAAPYRSHWRRSCEFGSPCTCPSCHPHKRGFIDEPLFTSDVLCVRLDRRRLRFSISVRWVPVDVFFFLIRIFVQGRMRRGGFSTEMRKGVRKLRSFELVFGTPTSYKHMAKVAGKRIIFRFILWEDFVPAKLSVQIGFQNLFKFIIKLLHN